MISRLHNLVQKVKLAQRNDDDAEGTAEFETVFGRGYKELKPYGLTSKHESAAGVCMFIGGEVRSPLLLPIAGSHQDGPRLEAGEAALKATM